MPRPTETIITPAHDCLSRTPLETSIRAHPNITYAVTLEHSADKLVWMPLEGRTIGADERGRIEGIPGLPGECMRFQRYTAVPDVKVITPKEGV